MAASRTARKEMVNYLVVTQTRPQKGKQIFELHGSTLHFCSSRLLWKRLAAQMPLQMRRRTPTLSPYLANGISARQGTDTVSTDFSRRTAAAGADALDYIFRGFLFAAVA